MNRALDACHKAGIGLISMKQLAGNVNLDSIARQLPDLTVVKVANSDAVSRKATLQALRGGILDQTQNVCWLSSCCVSMRNTDQVRENSEAARTFKPLSTSMMERMRDACIAAGPTLCTGCDGRCSLAAGTLAELGNLTRFLTYHEHHGYRGEARRLYSEMTEPARNWTGADLEAARHPGRRALQQAYACRLRARALSAVAAGRRVTSA